ncbi:asialoglycoprotein receptor 1-like [Thalassophryne amazonica]|uniref:asialoglycoprotein receptor 1-like n=1 Tax=Thalassophryne amazonica TaxID=390379 RepID=UPI001470AF36|nr:asialoglycoprotein receptor 1-like [Thalassophryne amazonica]
MTAEYHDDTEDDSSNFWTKEPPISLSSMSRFKRWLVPVVMVIVFLVLVLALGISNAKSSNGLWAVQQRVSNLSDVVQSLSATAQLTKDTAKEVHRLQFAVENNRDQLSSVLEAVKQLSVLDTLKNTVATLQCHMERFMSNGSLVGGCCPFGWHVFESSCYFFSSARLSWDESRNWCSGQEAHLVILNTDQEWDFVTSHTVPVFFWIGLTDERTGKWEWVNQTPYDMDRRRWIPGQPDAWTGHGFGPGDEDCAHLHANGHLNDLHCSTRMRFICQKDSFES